MQEEGEEAGLAELPDITTGSRFGVSPTGSRGRVGSVPANLGFQARHWFSRDIIWLMWE